MINAISETAQDLVTEIVESETAIDFMLGSIIGGISWFFGGLDGFVKMLLTFAIVDYFSGLAAALWVKHNISSTIGFKGISKKCLMFCFVGIAHILDKYMLGEAGVLKEVVCLFYIGNEGISIIENAEKLGVPIPKFLHGKFLKFTEHNEETDKSI